MAINFNGQQINDVVVVHSRYPNGEVINKVVVDDYINNRRGNIVWVRPFKLNAKTDGHCKVYVNRLTSGESTATTGYLTNGATIYYEDTLEITASADYGYKLNYNPSGEHIVKGNLNLNLTTTVKPKLQAPEIAYTPSYSFDSIERVYTLELPLANYQNLEVEAVIHIYNDGTNSTDSGYANEFIKVMKPYDDLVLYFNGRWGSGCYFEVYFKKPDYIPSTTVTGTAGNYTPPTPTETTTTTTTTYALQNEPVSQEGNFTLYTIDKGVK